MEVKINKSNNQKYVTIPKESILEEGDKVDVIKKNMLSKQELLDWYESNKDVLKEVHNELYEFTNNFDLSPEMQFSEYLAKRYKLDIEYIEGCVDIRLGDVYVSMDGYYEEAFDYDNYFNPETYDYEDNVVFKEEVIESIDEETFRFDEKYFEENYNNFEDSMKIYYYMKIKNKIQKDYDNEVKRILKRAGFNLLGWGGDIMSICNESVDIYKHEKDDIYLSISMCSKYLDEIYLLNSTDDDYEEVPISLK